jgi:TonB family protein
MDTTDSPPPVTLGSNLLAPRRRSVARRWLIILSMVVHGGAIAAYVVVGMLRVERLKPDRGRITVSLGMQLPDQTGGPEPGSKPKDPPKPKRDEVKTKIQVDTTVQPTTDTSKISNTGQSRTSTSELPGTGSGHTPSPGSDSTKPPGGGCQGEDCPPPETTTTKKPEPKPEAELTPQDMKLLNTTPDDLRHIQPNDVTKTAIQRDGKAKVVGIVRVCIDERGRISKTSLTKSTGYSAYDSALVTGVRRWTYNPAIKDGVATPACSTVFFTFILK